MKKNIWSIIVVVFLLYSCSSSNDSFDFSKSRSLGDSCIQKLDTMNALMYYSIAGKHNNDDSCQLILGKYYLRNPVESQYWLHRSANNNNTRAQYILANRYWKGVFGFYYNEEKAIKFWEEAANNGHILSMQNLADAYANGGYQLEKNERQAFKWIKKIAEGVNGVSMPAYQVRLGECYLYGIGVSANANEGVKWLKKGGCLSPRVQLVLGGCYLYGMYGVSPDIREAIKWLEAAAKNREGAESVEINGEAETSLALIYLTGDKGVEVNKKLGLKWLEKALKDGNKDAKTIKKIMDEDKFNSNYY